MDLLFVYSLYFLAGVIQEILITAFYLAASERKIVGVFFFSIATTMVGYGVLYNLVLSPQFIWHLSSYALGGGVGAALAIWYKKASRHLRRK